MEPVNEVIVRSRQVQLLTSPRALSTVPSQPTVLQALYGTRKKLTATQWHVYGVEHMLPQTHVLNHPGMGATLQTYVRRLEGRDARARAAAESLADLTTVAEGPNSWRVGQVTPLGAQDASPFRIGDVDPGATILTIENGSSITVAAPHDPGNNYLLIRRPSGHMLVRKLSGCFLVRLVPCVDRVNCLVRCVVRCVVPCVVPCGVPCSVHCVDSSHSAPWMEFWLQSPIVAFCAFSGYYRMLLTPTARGWVMPGSRLNTYSCRLTSGLRSAHGRTTAPHMLLAPFSWMQVTQPVTDMCAA